MSRVHVAVLISFALFLSAAHANEAHHAAQAVSKQGMLVDGEVRRVDRDAKKITIRHGPLPQLDMPQPMTMVYQVRDAKLLDKAKPGDKVKFEAEKIGGAFVVTKIEPAK